MHENNIEHLRNDINLRNSESKKSVIIERKISQPLNDDGCLN